MKRILSTALGVLVAASLWAQQAQPSQPVYPTPHRLIDLWPNGAPTSNGITEPEYDYGNHVTNVTKPTLALFIPEKPSGLAIISCPGGGYVDVWDKTEGYSLAEWYNKMGIVYGVLKYRLPNGHREVPLDDLQEAMRYMRAHATELGIEYLGVQGNSAGGHLAATASTHYTSKATRPDFAVLFYPLIMLDPANNRSGSVERLLGKGASEALIAQYSNERCVTADTPPTFIMHCTDDDLVPVRHSTNYYNALVDHGVKNASLLVMPVGGHGWTDHEFAYRHVWMTALEAWLTNLKAVLSGK